jgi:PAS domain S-box-containing protein
MARTRTRRPAKQGGVRVVEQQLAVQARIAGLAQTLLSLPAEELDQGIREQLAVAAEIAGVDRTRLIVINPSSGRIAAAYDWWLQAGAAGLAHVDQDLLSRFPWVRERVANGEVVQIVNADSLPPEAQAERKYIEARNLHSTLILPVRMGDTVLGGHVFHSTQVERSWSEQEVANLRVVTEIFASAIRRRHAEHALRESEQRFRAIAEHATELVSEFDHRGRYHYASPSFERHLGHDPGELIGQHASTLVHPDDLEAATRTVARGVQKGIELRATHRMRHRDGSWRWFESSGGVYRTPNGSPRFVCIGRNVTERVAMEQAMARQFEAEQDIAALSRRFLAVSASELDTAIKEALAEAGALSGAERVVLYSRALQPERKNIFFYQWCAPGIATYDGVSCPWSEAQLARGKILHFGSIDELPPEAQAERETWQRNKILSMLVIPVRLEGELVGLIGFEMQTRPKRWSAQEIALLGMIGEILTSASRRCQVEEALRESQARLLHAQKLEAVGRLAGGIAHDFNNLLSVILGFSRPLLRELPESNPVREDVREIHEAAERGAGLTRQLLTFSRRQETQHSRIDLSAVVTGVDPMLRRLLGDDIELVLELEGPTLVWGDPQQLEQIAINLAVNARDAMPDGGTFRLRSRNLLLDEAEASRRGVAPGSYVWFAADDTGCGMDDETRARIFEPFFTTKEPGKGTGLGLSIVYSVVEQAGGVIQVQAQPGKGTTFEILLPSPRGAQREGTGRSSSGPSGRAPSTSRNS